MGRSLRLFALSLFCTLLIAVVLWGFVVADTNTRQAGFGDVPPVLRVERTTPLQYKVDIMGARYTLSLQWLNTAVYYAQQASAFSPAGGRLLIKLLAVARAF